MNIFLLSIHPHIAANLLADVHAVKMTLETLQMLWTALQLSFTPYIWPLEPYKLAHVNHPSTKWVRYSPENFSWTLQLGYNICKVFQQRYNKVHKCMKHYEALLSLPLPKFNTNELKFDKFKIATCGVPECCSFFPLAIAEEIFNQVAVWKNGMLHGTETYQNYYKHKEKTTKRKMRWNKTEDSVENVLKKKRFMQ